LFLVCSNPGIDTICAVIFFQTTKTGRLASIFGRVREYSCGSFHMERSMRIREEMVMADGLFKE
jgi:hypothetical protein